MRVRNFLTKTCEIINKIVSWIVTILFGVMLVACVCQVFTRYVLNNSAIWTDETARYTFMWATMLSATILTWTKGHAVLSFVVDAMPGILGKSVRVFIEALVLCIGVILVRYSGHILKVARIQKSPALHLRMDMVYIAVPICGALFVLYSAVHIIQLIFDKEEQS